MAKTVNVYCGLHSGLTLRTFRMKEGLGRDDQTGVASAPEGVMITLKNGFNPGIDKYAWDKWLEQNGASESVTGGYVSAKEEEVKSELDGGKPAQFGYQEQPKEEVLSIASEEAAASEVEQKDEEKLVEAEQEDKAAENEKPIAE